MSRWRTSLSGAALFPVSASALAPAGDLFARGERTPVFGVGRAERVDGGDRTITVRYVNPDGTEAAGETAVLRGERLVRSEVVQRQVGAVEVAPPVLTCDADAERQRAHEGRAALERRDGASWRDFDGLTVYRDGP